MNEMYNIQNTKWYLIPDIHYIMRGWTINTSSDLNDMLRLIPHKHA